MKTNNFALAAALLFLSGCGGKKPLKADPEPPGPSEMRQMLQKDRANLDTMSEELDTLRRSGSQVPVSVAEIVASPEKYMGKEVFIKARVGAPPMIREPVSYVRLKGESSEDTLDGYFVFDKLEGSSRKRLSSAKEGRAYHMRGNLVESSDGIGHLIGILPENGYEFHISLVEN